MSLEGVIVVKKGPCMAPNMGPCMAPNMGPYMAPNMGPYMAPNMGPRNTPLHGGGSCVFSESSLGLHVSMLSKAFTKIHQKYKTTFSNI